MPSLNLLTRILKHVVCDVATLASGNLHQSVHDAFIDEENN